MPEIRVYAEELLLVQIKYLFAALLLIREALHNMNAKAPIEVRYQ
jgi:hypothetical protein